MRASHLVFGAAPLGGKVQGKKSTKVLTMSLAFGGKGEGGLRTFCTSFWGFSNKLDHIWPN